jgi:hypothetical protein
MKRSALTLAAVAVVQFMGSLDSSVVNVGLQRVLSLGLTLPLFKQGGAR